MSFPFFSAEDHLGNLFKRIAFTEVICVLDPPRGGLGPKAINHIRKNDAIKKLVNYQILFYLKAQFSSSHNEHQSTVKVY